MEIRKGIKLIEGLNRGKFPYCNVLKVGDVVIDAGGGIEIMRKINAEILILSHFHPDHSSGAWLFRRVLAPEAGRVSLNILAERYVSKELIEVWKRFIKAATGFETFECEAFSGETVVADPEIVAIPVRGHTSDHHVFLIEQKVLYGADVDLTSFGPFYGNPEADPHLFEREIEKLLNLDFEIFVSAHNQPIFDREEAEERIWEFRKKFAEREERLLEILEEPKSIDEIVEISPIYGRKPYAKEILDFFERTMVEKHLKKLLEDGRVKIEGGKYVKS